MTEEGSATEKLITAVELFEILPEKPTVSSKPHSWNGIIAEYYHHRPNSLASPTLREHLVTLNCGSPYNLVQRIDGRVHEGRVVKGNIILTPAGHPTEWAWQNEVDVLHLRLTSAFVTKVAAQALEIDPDQVEIVHQFSIAAPMIEQVGRALLSELQSEDTGSQLYIESLTNVLAVHLLKHYSTAGRIPEQIANGLPQYKLRCALDYINANLEEAFTLAELAKVVGMSPYYFARQFKQSTGLAPHQYLSERRIERAKELLTDTNASIADIGLRLGFSNQSHFTAQFHKQTGTTPRNFRKSL